MHLSLLEVSLEKTREREKMHEMIGGAFHGESTVEADTLPEIQTSGFCMTANSFPKHPQLIQLVWLPPYRNFTKL